MLLRILQISLALSAALMAGMHLGRSAIPRVFTGDPAVVAAAQGVMPVLAALMVRCAASSLQCLKRMWRPMPHPRPVLLGTSLAGHQQSWQGRGPRTGIMTRMAAAALLVILDVATVQGWPSPAALVLTTGHTAL